MSKRASERARKLENAPMEYAPENELGVVFLFSALAKRKGLRIESVRAGFPDCIAYQRTGRGERRKRIEFEFRSSNFWAHKHDLGKCDMIVCWEHDRHDVPKRIEVLELRREFDLGFNVWIQPLLSPYKDEISKIDYDDLWSVASGASEGDLILYYHTRPDKCIKDVFKLVGRVQKTNNKWHYMGPIRRVCRLKSPLFLEDMKRDRILRTAGFVRANMQGRPRATEFWPYLYDMIVRKNPSLRKRLSRFDPSRV
jgi:hypothetical protein